MKIINLLISLLLILSVNTTKAQDTADQKYGDDPETCKMNLSLYVEFYKQKNYEDALIPWRNVFSTCPKSSKNMYIHGVKIIAYQIKAAKKVKNTELANKYIDTLMAVYDQRIKYFGQEASVLGRKGTDLFKYNRNRSDEAYGYLLKSIDNSSKPSVAVALAFMKVSILKFKEGSLSKEAVVENYSKSIQVLEDRIKAAPEKTKYVQVKDNIEELFISVGPDCETIVKLFKPKFDATPNDLDLLKNITKVLDKQNCTESQLFFEASEMLYELEPSAESAINMARMAKKQSDNTKSISYYEKAIDLQTDAETKANYYLELAALYKSMGKLSQARAKAYKAAENKANWGLPYLFIGTMYATSAVNCGENDFEKKTGYWAAVDKFKKAKLIDPSIADDANKLIGTYSQYFPDKENAFFYNVIEGQTYNIGCWINESTTVRF